MEQPCQRKLRPPTSAAALGALGLLPFFAAAGAYAYGPPAWAGPALLTLLTYAATVLAFLGGSRWGIELAVKREPRWKVLGPAVLPQLAGFGLLAAPRIDAAWQIGGLLLAFVAVWLWDSFSKSPPCWYARLRTLLTLGAVLSLAAALEATLSL